MRTPLALSLILLAACEPTQENRDKQVVQAQQAQYAAGQPIPHFDWSLERDVTIQLYQARNEEVSTHTVWRSDTGVIEGDCPSIGFPLPYDTSLTNPLQAVGYHECQTSIEQAEPNGIFASKNSIATWIRCVYDGKQVPVYVEGKVTAYPFPVEVNYGTNRAIPIAGNSPSLVIEKGRGDAPPSSAP